MTAARYTTAEIAGAIGKTKRAIEVSLRNAGCPFEEESCRGGRKRYWLASGLPTEIQAALALKLGRLPDVASGPANENDLSDADVRRASLWAVYDRKPQSMKDRAAHRLRILQAVERLMEGGTPKLRAIAIVAKEAGESARTVEGWFKLVKGADRHDWLPALAPKWSGRTKAAACSPEAWAFFKADYLRLERPCAESCYRRLERAAAAHGWTIPALRTLMRRIDRELSPAAVTLARKGEEALKRMYPAQQRDHSVFRALEAVNADGHEWNVAVRFPAALGDPETIARPVIVVWQDIYSGKILSWRVDRTEHADLVRLAFADLVERYGAPDHAYLDNGRGFASKWITGGAPNRYRFKVKPEDPSGVLTLLDVRIHWATPYHGQAKPVERAFRDFCEDIAKHPAFAGAWLGNKPEAKPENYGSRAVPLQTFLQVVESEIAAHNARLGRRSPVCAGRSFDQVFAESYAEALVRWPTADQRRLLLLAAESVTANREDGSIRLFGNRYWTDDLALQRVAGRKVVVRFDPERLAQPVHVYTTDGRFVATADRVEAAGFDDVAAAREHAKARKSWMKAQKQQLAAERRMTALEAAALLPDVPEPPAPTQAKVVRPVYGNLAVNRSPLAAQPGDPTPEEFEEAFQRRVAQLAARQRNAL